MKTKISLITLIISLFLIACEKEKDQINRDANLLIGSWINPQYNDTLVTYERFNSLKDNDYGFSIIYDSKFIERKNSGWCGTPPISYSDYEGNWTQNDSIISITVGYWGGLVDYKWRIVSIDENNLTIIHIENVYHKEID